YFLLEFIPIRIEKVLGAGRKPRDDNWRTVICWPDNCAVIPPNSQKLRTVGSVPIKCHRCGRRYPSYRRGNRRHAASPACNLCRCWINCWNHQTGKPLCCWNFLLTNQRVDG